MNIIDKAKALTSLFPTKDWVLYNDELKWLDTNTPEPTDAVIDAEIKRLQDEYDSQEYARNRKAEYPDWGTQLNKIYDDGLAKWKSEMVDPIKAKYPKPE